RRVPLRAAIGSLRPQAPAAGGPAVLLAHCAAVRARAELHHLPGAARAVRARHGGGVGRGGVARHGEGLAPLSRRDLRAAAAWLRAGLSARGPVLLLRVPALGLAAAVLHRRPAGAAGAVRASTSAGVRGVATDPARHLAGAR